jgi:hypothetical protein
MQDAGFTLLNYKIRHVPIWSSLHACTHTLLILNGSKAINQNGQVESVGSSYALMFLGEKSIWGDLVPTDRGRPDFIFHKRLGGALRVYATQGTRIFTGAEIHVSKMSLPHTALHLQPFTPPSPGCSTVGGRVTGVLCCNQFFTN